MPCLPAAVQGAVPQSHACVQHPGAGESEEKPGSTEHGEWLFFPLTFHQMLSIFIPHNTKTLNPLSIGCFLSQPHSEGYEQQGPLVWLQEMWDCRALFSHVCALRRSSLGIPVCRALSWSLEHRDGENPVPISMDLTV